jgi:hypothetical protein
MILFGCRHWLLGFFTLEYTKLLRILMPFCLSAVFVLDEGLQLLAQLRVLVNQLQDQANQRIQVELFQYLWCQLFYSRLLSGFIALRYGSFCSSVPGEFTGFWMFV